MVDLNKLTTRELMELADAAFIELQNRLMESQRIMSQVREHLESLRRVNDILSKFNSTMEEEDHVRNGIPLNNIPPSVLPEQGLPTPQKRTFSKVFTPWWNEQNTGPQPKCTRCGALMVRTCHDNIEGREPGWVCLSCDAYVKDK